MSSLLVPNVRSYLAAVTIMYVAYENKRALLNEAVYTGAYAGI